MGGVTQRLSSSWLLVLLALTRTATIAFTQARAPTARWIDRHSSGSTSTPAAKDTSSQTGRPNNSSFQPAFLRQNVRGGGAARLATRSPSTSGAQSAASSDGNDDISRSSSSSEAVASLVRDPSEVGGCLLLRGLVCTTLISKLFLLTS